MINAFIPHSAFLITPSDATIFAKPAYGVEVTGAGGTVVYEDMSGVEWTKTCVTGDVILMQIRKVKAASTATGIRGYNINNI